MIDNEADKAYFSRLMPLIKQLECHASAFSAKNPELCDGHVQKKNAPKQAVTIISTFHSRLREFYYRPSLSAAYLLDPVHFQKGDTDVFELAYDSMLQHEQEDATSDIERLGGISAVRELASIRLHGFAGLNLSTLDKLTIQECVGVQLHETDQGAVHKAAPVHQRRQLWMKVFSRKYPALSRVAAQYLSMHGTSRASERNLSVFGRLYDKSRGRLQLTRAEKMIYLSVNDRIVRGTLVATEEELLPFTDLKGADEPFDDAAGVSGDAGMEDVEAVDAEVVDVDVDVDVIVNADAEAGMVPDYNNDPRYKYFR
jgi:hypothetical protein